MTVQTQNKIIEREKVREYYDNVGWKLTRNGITIDTEANVDRRFYHRIKFTKPRGFPKKGKYLLDAGCGANPRTHLSKGFCKHVCLDFSFRGLAQAPLKLDGKGLAILADITQLPFADNFFDAIICDHTLYHLIPSDQLEAFKELYRVLCWGGSYGLATPWGVSG